jgi:phosphosulfolactate synthase (CoM biosynthesis protein A)
MVAARFLLKPGRKYEEAVKAFSPYKSVKEVNDEARAAGKKLIVGAKQQGKQAFIYVNNRLEGNALETIAAMTEGLDLVR